VEARIRVGLSVLAERSGESSGHGHKKTGPAVVEVRVSGVRKKITCSKLSLLVIRTPLRTPERRLNLYPCPGQKAGQHTTIKLAASNSTSFFGCRVESFVLSQVKGKVTKVPPSPSLPCRKFLNSKVANFDVPRRRLAKEMHFLGRGEQPSSACLDIGQ